MAIVVSCRCGKRFAATDSLRGGERKCPACGEKIPIVTSPDSVDVEDWLLDSLSDSELTSISHLTRSGAALNQTGGGKSARRWPSPLRWISGVVRLAVGTRLGRICTAIAVLVIVPAMMLTVWSMRSAGRLAAEKAYIARSGEPTSLQELSDSYRIDDEETDTTAQWLEGIQSLGGRDYAEYATSLPIVSIAERPGSVVPPPRQTWRDMWRAERLTERFHNELVELREIANSPGEVRYPLEFEGGAGGHDYQQFVVNGARLLSLEAHIRAHQGSAEGAADSTHAVLALGRTLSNKPTLQSHRDMIECQRLACERIRQFLGYLKFSPQELEQLRGALQTLDFRQSLYLALVGERVAGLARLENPSSSANSNQPTAARGTPTASSEDAATYLACMNRAVSASHLPMEEALVEARAIDAYLDAQVAQSAFGRRRFVRALQNVPLMHQTFAETAEAMAMQRCTDAALAAELHRLETGRLPQRLGELVPAYLGSVPTDPRGKAPLFCGQDRDGFFVACGGHEEDSEDGAHNYAQIALILPGFARPR